MNQISNSPKGTLNEVDWAKTSRMFFLVLGGAATSFILQQLQIVDFGPYQQVITLFVAPLLELARRYFTDHTVQS